MYGCYATQISSSVRYDIDPEWGEIWAETWSILREAEVTIIQEGKVIRTKELYEKHRFPTDQKCFQSNEKAFAADITGVGNFGVTRRK